MNTENTSGHNENFFSFLQVIAKKEDRILEYLEERKERSEKAVSLFEQMEKSFGIKICEAKKCLIQRIEIGMEKMNELDRKCHEMGVKIERNSAKLERLDTKFDKLSFTWNTRMFLLLTLLSSFGALFLDFLIRLV